MVASTNRISIAPTSAGHSADRTAMLSANRTISILWFLIGSCFSLALPVGGSLILAEPLIVFAAWMVMQFGRQAYSIPRFGWIVLILFILSFAALFGFDVFTGVEPSDGLKVWARQGSVCLLIWAFMVIISHDAYSQKGFLVGSCVGVIIAILSNQNYIFYADVWKYNLAPWAAMAVLAVSAGKSFRIQAAAVTFVILSNIVTNYRALSLVGVATLAILVGRRLLTGVRANNNTKRFAAILTIVIVGSVGYTAYEFAVDGGLLGQVAQQKHMFQKQFRQGFLNAARPELEFGWRAISRSPIMPQGSTPDAIDLAEGFYQRLEDEHVYGSELAYQKSITGVGVPIHSLLHLWWVESGIIGGITWIIVAGLCIVYVDRYVVTRTVNDITLAFLSIYMLWNIMFSPMPPQFRMESAETIGPLIMILFSHRLARMKSASELAVSSRRSPARPNNLPSIKNQNT